MLDNPLYAKRKSELMAELEGLPESYRNTVLYGEWYNGEHTVYAWDESMIVPLPETYSRGWRHVEAVDPALKSKMGYLQIAEDPSTGIWHLVEDTYVEGILDPMSVVAECARRSGNLHVIRRVSDVAPWFTETAAKQKLAYLIPFNKTQRKEELIKGLQSVLSSGKLKVSPHCTNFIDEITSCQWSETADRIVNGQSYHCLDAAQYFVDLMPKPDVNAMAMPWEVELRMKNEQRKKLEKQKKIQVSNRGARTIGQWGRSRMNWGRK
jgi:hypothetical protein